MKKLFSGIILSLLLVFMLFCMAFWRFPDQMLNGLVRPPLETIAAELLDAEIHIDRLRWTGSGLEINLLQLTTPRATGSIPQLTLNFTWASLWDRQFNEVLISSPQLTLTPSAGRKSADGLTLELPAQLPLWIERLQLSDGQLTINSPDWPLTLHQVNLSGTLQPHSSFQLSAFVGFDEQQPVELDGHIQFSPEQMLQLDRFSWQGQQLLKDPLSLMLSGGKLETGSPRIELANFDSRQLRNLLSSLGHPTLLPVPLSFELEGARFGFSLQDGIIQFEAQVGSGQIGWDKWQSPFSALHLSLARNQQGWEVAGQSLGPAQSSFRFNTQVENGQELAGEAKIKIPDLERLKAAVFGGTALQVRGGLQVVAEYALVDESLDMTATIQGQEGAGPGTDYLFDVSRLNGQGILQMNDAGESFTLNLEQGSRPFFSLTGSFQKFQATLTAASLDDLKPLLTVERLPAPLQAVNELKIAGNFSGPALDWTGRLDLSASEILVSGLALEKMTGQSRIQVTENQLNLSETSFSSKVAYAETATARFEGDGSVELSDNGFSLALRQLSLTDLNYSAADGLAGVGAGRFSLQGQVTGGWPLESFELDINAGLGVREVLAGAFYADLGDLQADIALRGEWNIPSLQLNATTLEVALPGIASLTASGRFSPEQISSQGQLKLLELDTSFAKQFKPLLRDTYPVLAGLDLTGLLSLDYQGQLQPTGWWARGRVDVQGLGADWSQHQLKIVDGSGTLPFILGSGTLAATGVSDAEEVGEITFATLASGPATLEAGQLQLIAQLNRFDILSPLQLELADGRVEIKDFSLEWAQAQLQGSAEIDVADVKLESLTQDFGLPSMQGSLSASLGTIRYVDRQLSTGGMARIQVFDGQFQFRNMRYHEPFSRYPTFYADVDFSGLNLLQATRTFDFGEMNGILDGYVHGLQLFGTTPASFEAAVSTRQSGTRNISVKALNNLSILSQGGISAALSKGIYQFIDFYRYRSIGFKCTLVHDTFKLIGTALPDSNRYLVYGGLLPPRIDITTTTPTISFKEMVKRLGRIDRAGNRDKISLGKGG